MLHCPNCQRDCPDESNFCFNCGYQLIQIPAPDRERNHADIFRSIVAFMCYIGVFVGLAIAVLAKFVSTLSTSLASQIQLIAIGIAIVGISYMVLVETKSR